MKTIENQTFKDFDDADSGALYSDIEFRNCTFECCLLSLTKKPELRCTVRNVSLINCSEYGCTIRNSIIDECLIDGFKTNDLFQSWGAVFRHVTIRGKIGRMMFGPFVWIGIATPEEQNAFDVANAQFYKQVDWALDISKAEFAECDIRRVPARLIKRDPETQVVVKRYKLMDAAFRDLPLSKTYWRTALDLFYQDGDPDVVLVAAKRHKNFRNLLDGLTVLRKAGIAEPD